MGTWNTDGNASLEKVNLGTRETRFSEPQFSEILDLMNKLQLPFSYFTFIQTRFSEQTQFSEQKGSDNHVH